jgi:hypothetical protein
MKTYRTGPGNEPNNESPNTAGIFGGGSGSAGENLLQLAASESKNWRLDANEARIDGAQENGWRDYDETIFASQTTIDAHNEWDRQRQPPQSIDATNFLSTAPHPDCIANEGTVCAVPEPPDGGGGGPIALGGPSGRTFSESREEVTTGPVDGFDLPTVLLLHAPRPNPTRGGVVMQLDVPAAEEGRAEIRIYDVAGRRVGTLVSGEVRPGRHDVPWDLRDGNGRRVGSGVYFARMEFGAKRAIHRIVVLK